MRLNQRRRLAVNAMIDIALRQQAGPVALASLAHRQRVGLCCLAEVCARLRQAGLLHVSRGAGGGFTLGRGSAGISVADIVGAIDVAVPRAEARAFRSSTVDGLSERLDDAMQTHMAAIVLADLVAALRNSGVVVEARRGPAVLALRPIGGPFPVAVMDVMATAGQAQPDSLGRGARLTV